MAGSCVPIPMKPGPRRRQFGRGSPQIIPRSAIRILHSGSSNREAAMQRQLHTARRLAPGSASGSASHELAKSVETRRTAGSFRVEHGRPGGYASPTMPMASCPSRPAARRLSAPGQSQARSTGFRPRGQTGALRASPAGHVRPSKPHAHHPGHRHSRDRRTAICRPCRCAVLHMFHAWSAAQRCSGVAFRSTVQRGA